MESFVYDIDSIRGLNLSLKVPLPLFQYLIEEGFKFVESHENIFSVNNFIQIFEREAIELDLADKKFCINSLVYLLKFLRKKNIQPDHINRWLTENSLMPNDHRKFLVEQYRNIVQVEGIKKNLNLGKLKEIKWTINQFQGEDKYSNLKRLYILMEFHIQNDEGQSEKQIVNLTLQEFKVMQLEIKEIGEILGSYQQQQ